MCCCWSECSQQGLIVFNSHLWVIFSVQELFNQVDPLGFWERLGLALPRSQWFSKRKMSFCCGSRMLSGEHSSTRAELSLLPVLNLSLSLLLSPPCTFGEGEFPLNSQILWFFFLFI